MTKIQVFEPALCCSSGVCGPDVDQSLVSFAADADWLKAQGPVLERYNLAQEPMAFAAHGLVKDFLARSGQEGLPLVLVDDAVALTGRYPSRAELARWTGVAVPVVKVPAASDCCNGGKCC